MWGPGGMLGTRRTYRPWLARRPLAGGAGEHADTHRDRADATAGRCRDGIARRAGIPVGAYGVLPTSTVPTRRSPALAAHTSLVRCGASVTLRVAFQQRRLQHADAEQRVLLLRKETAQDCSVARDERRQRPAAQCDLPRFGHDDAGHWRPPRPRISGLRKPRCDCPVSATAGRSISHGSRAAITRRHGRCDRAFRRARRHPRASARSSARVSTAASRAAHALSRPLRGRRMPQDLGPADDVGQWRAPDQPGAEAVRRAQRVRRAERAGAARDGRSRAKG